MDIIIGGIIGITLLVVLFYLFLNRWLALLFFILGLSIALVVRITEDIIELVEGFFDTLIKFIK